MSQSSANEPSLLRLSGTSLSPGLFILQNTQVIVSNLTLGFLILLHSAHASWFCLGTLVALSSAKGLKLCIKQPRPEGAQKYGQAYGMPSTHSSSMAYFGVYLALASLLFPLHPTLARVLLPHIHRHVLAAPDGFGPTVVRHVLAAACLASAGAVCWSRVRLGHHTPAQVIAGASLGTVVALAWTLLWVGTDRLLPSFFDSAAARLPTGLKWLRRGVSVWGYSAERVVGQRLRSGWAIYRQGKLDVGSFKRELHALLHGLSKLEGEL